MGSYGGVVTRGEAKTQAIRAVVTRADGTVEDLGIVSYYHRNPLIHYPVNWWIKIKDMFR